MLRMHGTVYANYAVPRCDLLLVFEVRFGDCVTEKADAFASRLILSTVILIRLWTEEQDTTCVNINHGIFRDVLIE